MIHKRVSGRRPMYRRSLAGLMIATCALVATTTPSLAQQSSRPNGVVLRAVPEALDDNAVITVKVGGDRIGTQALAGLSGVELGLFADEVGGTAEFVCTSDVDGDCSFVIPGTRQRGPNRNRRFWVRQIGAAPTGWSFNEVLRTGNAGGANPELTPYTFQTGQQLRNTVTYSSTNEFMVGSGNTNRVASGGVWQLSRTNPALAPQCGLDVALVLDLSRSVSTSIGNLRGAADTFVDSLAGTPSRLALFSFSDVSPATEADQNFPALTPMSTDSAVAEFKARYASWTPGGDTNWDRGLFAAATATAAFDLAIVVTDGNPSLYNDPAAGPGDYTRFREVENAIFSANALKAEGTRVVVMAVSAAIDDPENTANLAAISGPVAGDGTNIAVADYSQLSNYAAAGSALRDLALRNCTGTVSMTKQIVPPGNVGADITGAQPAAAGWEFSATTGSPGLSGLPSTLTTTTDGTGAVNFALAHAPGTTSGDVTINETQQAGYAIVVRNGRNAECRDLVSGAVLPTVDENTSPSRPGFTIDAASDAAVTCTIFNRAPQPPAEITVDKRWIIDGDVFVEGGQPDGFDAQLSLTGPEGAGPTESPWGRPRGGYSVGDVTTISESTDLARSLCTLTSSRLTSAGGTAVDEALPFAAELTDQFNSFEITNVVACESRLTLVKRVEGGLADPAGWTLTGIGPAGALAGPSGTSGSADVTDRPVTPDVVYQLAESGGDPSYAQVDDRTSAESNPLSTGSMNCVEIDAAGTVIAGFADGINGGVAVPRGSRVRCTALNQTAELTLALAVTNSFGGSQPPSAWQLIATPGAAPPGTAVPADVQMVPGNEAGNSINIRPGVAYELSVVGPDGYELTGLSCEDSDGVQVETDAVTLDALQSVICTFSVSDQLATLTLQKRVEGDPSGAGADPADWTLTATPQDISGQPTVSGNGDPATSNGVSVRPVFSGRYLLDEDGPDGFVAEGWQCTGADSSGAVVVVPVGGAVTCTIVNTAIGAAITTPAVPPRSEPATPNASDPIEPTAPPSTSPISIVDGRLPATGGTAGRSVVVAVLVLIAGAGLIRFTRRPGRSRSA